MGMLRHATNTQKQTTEPSQSKEDLWSANSSGQNSEHTLRVS